MFWGLLMVLIVLLSIGALWYIRRRRQARQDAAPQESPPAVMEDPDNWKPKQIPIIVVFPDEGYAFGWKVAHEDDEEAGGKLPDDDDDDDIKDSEPRCSSLDSFTDEGLGTPTFPPV